MDLSGFCETHFAAKSRVSPLGSPSVINMLAPLFRRMFAFGYRENEFTLLQMKGFDLMNRNAEDSERTKRIQGWSHEIGLGTLCLMHCELFSV